MNEKSLKRNSLIYTLKNVLGLIFPVVTFPYASRTLLPSGIGKINFVNSIIDYFVLFAGLGITSYAIRESSKVRNNKIQFSKFAIEIILINLISTAISLLLLCFTIYCSDKLSQYKTLLIISSSKIILITFGLEWVYKTYEEFEYITRRTIVFQIISITYLFLFVRCPEDLNKYMIFTIISACGANICNILYVRKFITIRIHEKIELIKHIKPIFILFSADIASSVFTILDTTMIGLLRTDTEVGYYSASTKISRMLILTLSSLITVLLPRLSFFASNDYKKYRELLKKGANILMALSLPIICGLIILAKPIILLFCGDKFISSVHCMQIITPTIFILLFNTFFSDLIFLTHKKDVFILFPVIIGAIVNFCLNLVFIPRFGIEGAAISSIISESLILIIKFSLSFKIIGIPMFIFSKIYEYIIGSILMSICVKFLYNILEQGIISLFIEIISGIITYSLTLIIFRNPYFLNIIKVGKSKIISKAK